MTAEAGAEALEAQILSGSSPDLQRLAADGLVPLPAERLIPLQVKLTQVADPEVVELARESLAHVEPRLAAPVLAHDAAAEVVEYFALNSEHPLILETIIRLKGVSNTVLVDLAARLQGDVQEVLVLRQDAILQEPAILDALEANPDLRQSVRRRVQEYRQHLLPRAGQAPTPTPEDAEDADMVATPQEVATAIGSAFLEPLEGDIDDQTGLSEGQIRTLSIPVRLKLSRGAGKTLRDILIRDSNPLVAASTLKFNSWSDGEIERIARMRTMTEDVLVAIGRTKRWMRKYAIALALVKNPRTPIPMAVGLVPRIAVRDLRILRRDRNISDAVRTRANRLFLLKVG